MSREPSLAESIVQDVLAEITVPTDAQPPFYRVRAADVKLMNELQKLVEADPNSDFSITISKKSRS